MKSSLKFILPLICVLAVITIAQEGPAIPPAPAGPPSPPGLLVAQPPDQAPQGPIGEVMGDHNAPPPEQQEPQMRGPGEHQRPMGPMGQRIHHSIIERENELMSWLDKNEPNTAKELRALKEKDPRAYNRRMLFAMKNYMPIMDAEQSNPALAEVLKKDMVLKQKRNELLDQIKSTTDAEKKKDLTSQLKDVIGQRFDLIVEKKQLRYEDLKKRLADLQSQVEKSQAELNTIKDKKAEQVQKHLDDLLNNSEQINWD